MKRNFRIFEFFSASQWHETLHAARARSIVRDSSTLVTSHSKLARWVCLAFGVVIVACTFSLMREDYDVQRFVEKMESAQALDSGLFIVKTPLDASSTIELNIPVSRTFQDVHVSVWIPLERYSNATFYVGGVSAQSCFNNALCFIDVPGFVVSEGLIRIHGQVNRGSVKDKMLTGDPPILMISKDQEKIRNFLYEKRMQTSRRISVVVRIVLAVFCLVLFLAIERSPETLALSLFTSLEAIALLMGFNGIRPAILPDLDYTFLKHLCWSMADVFRLFFCLQIARVLTAQIKPWVVYGAALCVPYALIRHYATRLGYPELHDLWIYKDLGVSFVGFVLCLQSFQYAIKAQLYHRTIAIALVLLGLTSEFGNAAFALFPQVFELGTYSSMLGFLESNSAFLFCLGTILNISNLEQRVKKLTEEHMKSQQLKQQLDIAISLQKSFMDKPAMPDNFSLFELYQPASFVGGDMYFIHWDEGRKTAVILLNDVVGHGVSSAMQAFGAHMIARALWREDDSKHAEYELDNRRGEVRRLYDRRQEDSRLRQFDKLIRESMYSPGRKEFVSFVGLEINFRQNVVSVYRANHMFPILVDVAEATVKPLTTPNERLVHYPIKSGQLLVVLSDGLVTTIRDLDEFSKSLSAYLLVRPFTKADSIMDFLKDWSDCYGQHLDDRTAVVLFYERLFARDSESLESEKVAS